MFKYIKVTCDEIIDIWVWLKRIWSNNPRICNNLPPQSQALDTQRLIKRQFEQLYQVLHQEESARIAAVKKEEEEKIAGMKEKMKELSAEVLFLTETISVIQEQLKEDDMVLLKVRTVRYASAF